MKIVNLDDITNPRLNVLVYAPPGHGKTRFAGTMAKVCKPIILSAESGLLSLKKLSKEMGYKFQYSPITKFQDIVDAYQDLAFKNEHKFDGVIIDSISEIQKVCMDHILEEEEREKPEIQDWGTLNQKMVGMIRKFRDLDMHFTGTALAERSQDENTGLVTAMPMLQGAIKHTIAAYFDEVFYMHVKEIKDEKTGQLKSVHWLQTQASPGILAKDRSGMLNREEPADFSVIYKKIIGEIPPKEPIKQAIPMAKGAV